MSELQIINVFEVDPASLIDPHRRKAAMAMRATAMQVQNLRDASRANEELIDTSLQLGAAPSMTYEDLIFHNPLDDEVIVMSTDQKQAQNEAAFYVGHKAIERHLADTIKGLRKDSVESLDHMNLAVDTQVELHHRLGVGAFDGFRPYFIGLNCHAGPSGLFSAAIPIVDILSHGGRNIDQAERERMLRHIRFGLYPSHQSTELERLLRSGNDALVSPEISEGMIQGLNRFRNVHRGSVRKFVPGALDSQAAGSGGVADVAGYLASKFIKQEEETEK